MSTKDQVTALDVALDPQAESAAALHASVAVFRVLANPGRLTILAALNDPATVPQLRVATGLTDPGSHLRDLEVAGLAAKVAGTFPVQWTRTPDLSLRLSRLAALAFG